MFGSDFTREKENEVNAALNYGYAIIRSYIAKTLICEGLEPSLGIHHKNQLNSFNLADDIIEPFRPVVDNYVYNNYKDWGNEFYTFQKAELVRLLNCKTIVLAGGVAANSELRKRLEQLNKEGYSTHAPELKYCTDNASMVAS